MDHSRQAPPPDDGFEGDEMPEDPGEPGEAPPSAADDEARQLRYLADAPQWALVPPRASVFANATWLEAERPEIALVHEVLQLEEFAPFGPLDIVVRWRRHSKPMHAWRTPKPNFATILVVDPRMIWEAERAGTESFPRLIVDFHWQHFVDRREVAPFYVHGEEVKFDLHHALSSLIVENEAMRKGRPDVSGYAKTIERFGLINTGIRAYARAAMLRLDDDEPEAEG
jgi:hypothetical protein